MINRLKLEGDSGVAFRVTICRWASQRFEVHRLSHHLLHHAAHTQSHTAAGAWLDDGHRAEQYGYVTVHSAPSPKLLILITPLDGVAAMSNPAKSSEVEVPTRPRTEGRRLTAAGWILHAHALFPVRNTVEQAVTQSNFHSTIHSLHLVEPISSSQICLTNKDRIIVSIQRFAHSIATHVVLLASGRMHARASHLAGPLKPDNALSNPRLLNKNYARHASTTSRRMQLRPRGLGAAAASDGEAAIVLVDHGSRRQEANDMLEQFAEVYRYFARLS